MDLDAALSAYPCTPCNFAVSDLDDLDPVAEHALAKPLRGVLSEAALAAIDLVVGGTHRQNGLLDIGERAEVAPEATKILSPMIFGGEL